MVTSLYYYGNVSVGVSLSQVACAPQVNFHVCAFSRIRAHSLSLISTSNYLEIARDRICKSSLAVEPECGVALLFFGSRVFHLQVTTIALLRHV